MCDARVDFGNIECAAILRSHIVYLELMAVGWVEEKKIFKRVIWMQKKRTDTAAVAVVVRRYTVAKVLKLDE